MKRLIAVILFTLFNLGVFGVSIEQHLCCHSQQEENTGHCNEDESCCGDAEDCCEEIISQIKIAKDFTSQDSKIEFEQNPFVLCYQGNYYKRTSQLLKTKNTAYSANYYFPPPKNFQVLFSSFLI